LGGKVFRGIQDPALRALLDADSFGERGKRATFFELDPHSSFQTFAGWGNCFPSEKLSVDQKCDFLRNFIQVFEVMRRKKEGSAFGEEAV
jgi:hypothetical protein